MGQFAFQFHERRPLRRMLDQRCDVGVLRARDGGHFPVSGLLVRRDLLRTRSDGDCTDPTTSTLTDSGGGFRATHHPPVRARVRTSRAPEERCRRGWTGGHAPDRCADPFGARCRETTRPAAMATPSPGSCRWRSGRAPPTPRDFRQRCGVVCPDLPRPCQDLGPFAKGSVLPAQARERVGHREHCRRRRRPGERCRAALRTQSRTRSGPRRLAATRATPSPSSRTSRTASALNSGGYVFLMLDTGLSLTVGLPSGRSVGGTVKTLVR